jgi:hypothetical protein
LRAAFLFAAAHAARAGNVDVLWMDGFENGCGNLMYAEPFAMADGAAWPAPWSALGNVASADVQQQSARLRPMPTNYSLARMGASLATSSVEVRFTLRFEDVATQGVGFYIRQNGGYLTQTMPHGQGYAAFVEGSFRGLPGIGLWKEIDGVEMQIAHAAAPTSAMENGVDYRVRYQVLQIDSAQTLSRAKLWIASGDEPAAWQTSVVDMSASLQGISGGIAVDSWSSLQTGASITAHTFVDNIEIIALCSP